jgi:hypothetical protein
MARVPRSTDRRKQKSRLVLKVAGSLLLLLVILSLAASLHYGSTAGAFMDKQSAALLSAFHSDLEALADAPRYTLQATLDPQTGSLTGQLNVRYTNTADESLSELVFRLLPNAKSIYGGGSLGVSSAKQGENPLKTSLSNDRTALRILLDEPLEAGDTISVDLTFHGRVPEQTGQGYGMYNRALGVVSLAGWYPILAVYQDGWQAPPVPATGDAMWAETSLYEVTLTVPDGYEVVSTGTVIGQQKRGEQTTWHVVSGPAREFAASVSDRFQTTETQVGDVVLRYHTLPAQQSVASPADGREMMAAAFETYAHYFGPYPYSEVDMVETAVSIDGYEFSGLVYVDYVVRTQEKLDDLQYIVAHEIAHQWWYGLVGNSTAYEPWLDEALVTYSAALYIEAVEGDQALDRLLAAWQSGEGTHSPEDPPLNSTVFDFSSWGPYHRIAYTHGALFLHQLRQEMGDDKFFELLERYLARYRYKMATTGDFLGLAEEVAGRDLTPLFEQWFDLSQVDLQAPGTPEASP